MFSDQLKYRLACLVNQVQQDLRIAPLAVFVTQAIMDMRTGATACIARQACDLSCPYVFTDFYQNLGQMAVADLIVAMIDNDKVTAATIIACSLYDTIHHCIDLCACRNTEVDAVMRHLLMVDGVVSHTIL